MQPAAGKQVEFHAIVPIFLTNEVVKTAEWYRDALGFAICGFWGEPTCFSIIGRGRTEIFLKGPECAGEVLTVHSNCRQAEVWDAYVRVNDADALCEEIRAKGVKIVRELETAFYGMREFEVEDVNGYRLCFAHDTSGSSGSQG